MEEKQVVEALETLTREVERLDARNARPLRHLAFQFARGLMFGLGSVVGASLLVSVAAWWLSQIEFLPIIGNWAAQIASEISAPRP